MTKRAGSIVAACALLAACGEGGNGGEPIADTGVSVSGVASGQAAAPGNLPPFAPVYPGAKVTITTLNAQEPDKGMMVLAVPSADSAAIIAFYKQRGEAAGLKLGMETVTGAARIMAMNDTGETGADSARGLQVTVSPDDAGESTVTVVYAGGR